MAECAGAARATFQGQQGARHAIFGQRGDLSLSLARATLSELAEQVKAGAEKIVTENGESYIASIDAERLDDYHRLEREHIPCC